MKNKRKILIITGGVLLGSGLIYLIWRLARKDDSRSLDMDFDDFEQPINPKLNFVENQNIARYLSGILSESEMDTLRGWINLIDRERAQDPSKWGDANGLRGQVSRIGGALYQMQAKGQCSGCWIGSEVLDKFLELQ